MAVTEQASTAIWNDEFLDELEAIRATYMSGELLRPPKRYASLEEAAEAKRRRHLGGGGQNHKFVGEKYLRCEDKEIRRELLRKLVDEGGQQSCGVGLPSHPTLMRWNSNALGISDEEVHALEKEDPGIQFLLFNGWKIAIHRESHWAVTIGTSLVGEGEKVVPERAQALQDEIEELRRDYQSWGVKDLGRALANAIEHAGVDVEHANLSAKPVRKYITTPELKDDMRRHYILTLQQRDF